MEADAEGRGRQGDKSEAAAPSEQQMEATAAELAARQSGAARPQPGTLLLASEPDNPDK